jgi:thioredoxin reductase (NADPH)
MKEAGHSDAGALEPQFDLHSNQTAYPCLSEREIAEATAFGERCSFRANEVLFASGDKSFDSYTILAGQVRIIDISTGERVCFVRYGAGYFTGDIDLFTGRPSVVSCEAVTDVEAIRIKPLQLRGMFVKKPALGERYWKSFQQRRQLLLQSPFRGVSVYGPKDDKRTVEAVELLYRNCVPHFWCDTTLEENAAKLRQVKGEVGCYPVVTYGGNLLCDCPTRARLADTRSFLVAPITAPAYACPRRTMSPSTLASTRSSAATSSLSVVSRRGAQTTFNPCFCKGRMISVQLAHSAQAP